jgi:hypothetical protein
LASFLAQDQNVLTADDFLRQVTAADTWPNLALDTAVLRKALRAVEPFSLSDAIRTFYRLYAQRFKKARWGDKTPPYRRHMPGIQRLLPEAHFIHIVRDGRDVALSYRDLWFGPGDGITVQARFWAREVRAARAQATGLQHYLEIKYETLVGDPEATLARICDYLELPYDPGMLDYYKFAASRLAEIISPFGQPDRPPKDIDRFLAIHEHTKHPPDTRRTGRWRIEMSEDEQRRYEAVAGTLLRKLGYETQV